jgi:2-dehydro-3-deoxyglucarate aldolase/4-hydroxy-2-oxoheptanedioate aldolase
MNLNEWIGSKRPRLGTIVTVDNPAIIEVASLAGFDWLWIDAEHGQFNETGAALAAALCASGPPAFVRLPDFAPTTIKRYLDCGSTGIILPGVSSLADVQAIARAALYPPRGERSVGIGRACAYGNTFGEYLKSKCYSILVQIESVSGVRNAREIIAHQAVDAVLIGPYDLSGSLGIPGEIESPHVVEAITSVQALCRDAGKPCGIFAATAEKARAYAAQGFDMIATGIDTTILLDSYRQLLALSK